MFLKVKATVFLWYGFDLMKSSRPSAPLGAGEEPNGKREWRAMDADWAHVWAEAGTAVSTLAAVAVALWLARADSARRREEKERDQAEHVSGWIEFLPEKETFVDGAMYVQLVLLNSSQQLVYDLIASVVTAFGEYPVGSGTQFHNFIGRLPPGRTEYKIEHPSQGMHHKFAIELAFQDTSGRIWVRRGRGHLDRSAEEATLSVYGIDPPVGWLMP